MMNESLGLAKKLNRLSYVISAVVLLLVVLMRRIKLDLNFDFSFLPGVYSSLNALVAIILVYAYVQIRKKNIDRHKQAIIIALILSCVFLLMYVLYHITTEETLFCKEGWIRPVYFFLLISHIFLAAVSFPFILFTFVRGYTNQVAKHRKLAKWIFPIWLYVAVTGPIIYMLLYPCYS